MISLFYMEMKISGVIMESDGLWSLLNTPLFVGVACVILTALLQFKNQPLGLNKRIFKEVPGYVREAGVSSILFRCFYKETSLEKIKPLSVKYKIFAVSSSLFIALMFGVFSFYTAKIIIETPKGFTNLKFIDTNEKFIISENEAVSYPDRTQWRLNQDVCHSDVYQNLSDNFNISYDLVFMLCTTVGLDKERKNIKERVDKFKVDRVFVSLLIFALGVYAAFFIMVLCSPFFITPKLLKYWHDYLENKYMCL